MEQIMSHFNPKIPKQCSVDRKKISIEQWKQAYVINDNNGKSHSLCV